MSNYYVVNLHFTDKCNYKCAYCFSKKYKGLRELSFDEWCKVIDNILVYYSNNGIQNGRINLVGGEPLLNDNIIEMIDYVKKIGLEPSILTNGSHLNKQMIDSFEGKVKMIGISIDSLEDSTNLRIGRSEKAKTLGYQELLDLCSYIKSKNIILKINTAVSKLNCHEDFSRLYEDAKPDRVKIMQVYINEGVNEHVKHLVPSSEEFYEFAKRHEKYSPVVEDNNTMDSAYLMVDAQGFVISNANNGYIQVGNALVEDFEKLVELSNIDPHKFALRFK